MAKQRARPARAARSPRARARWSTGVKALLGISILVIAGISIWLVTHLTGGSQQSGKQPAAHLEPPPVIRATVLAEFPHDSSAFTQGLVFHKGELYESTGLYGQSTLRKVDLETGEVLEMQQIDDRIFAEGMTIFNDEIFQLSWNEGICMVYDLSLRPLRQHRYQTQGWGLTHTDDELILSDGSHVLFFIEPKTFAVKRKLPVYTLTASGERRPVSYLNELEYIDGRVWANVWMTEKIAIISPDTGLVLSWLDISHLYDARRLNNRDAVPNGIAFEPTSRRLFATGKLWPKLYEIELPSDEQLDPKGGRTD